MSDPVIDAMFVASFNDDLEKLLCEATVALAKSEAHRGLLELLDPEGNFIDFVPVDATPEMVAVAYRLYGRAFNQGVRAGEEIAWAKLRRLIGAAGAQQP
jgi:hypothetical protein